MRVSSGILISLGVLLGAAVIFLLLFWLAFPRWWPSLVISHSPSLRHALLADTYRRELRGPSAEGLFRTIPVADFSRFDGVEGKGLYPSLIELDDGWDNALTYEIIDCLAFHIHEADARAALQHYYAYEEVRDLLRRYHLENP